MVPSPDLPQDRGELPVFRAPDRTNVLALAPLYMRYGWHPAPVHGWTLPLWFDRAARPDSGEPGTAGGVYDEQRAARAEAAIFDRSHLGRFYVTGTAAVAAIGRLFATDPDRIAPRRVARALVCREDGTVLDLPSLCHLGEGRWLIVTGPRAQAGLRELVERAVAPGEDVLVRDRLAETVMLSVQGPTSSERLGEVIGAGVSGGVPAGEAHELLLGGYRALVARTSHIGEDGYWLIVSPEVAEHVWEGGIAAGIVPAGLVAHDVLRMEAGVLEAPHETPPPVHPAAAGLQTLVHLADAAGTERSFPGAAALRAERPPERLIRGLRIEGRLLPRRGTRLLAAGADVGACVAAGYSAALSAPVALAYLPPELESVDVVVDGVRATASVVEPPLLRPAAS